MGRYIDENLAKDEKLIYETRLHWIVFFWPGVFLLFTLIGLPSIKLVPGFFWTFFIITIITGGLTYLNRKYSEFALTNKRILIKVGVFSVKTLETQLNKISNISVSQGILGRILGYGSVLIASTGGVKETYPRIENPIEFKKKIQEHIENH